MIIVRIWEGLGNQLFQYAFARALSLSTKQRVFLDIRETGESKTEYGEVHRICELRNFRVRLPICTNVQHFYPYLNSGQTIKEVAKAFSKNEWLLYKYHEETASGYHENLLELTGNWYLQGWFQDSRYFEKYNDLILKELSPRSKIRISAALSGLLKERNTVSVHIRRGDYVKAHNMLSVNYYKNAMKHAGELIKDPFWIVFSDEPEWVKKNFDFGENCYYVSGNEILKDYEELMVMSCCRNNIIANSTFSWWGAWLNRNPEKIIIAPDKWRLKGISGCGTDILPAGWIRESAF